jgi:KaiC/GvpD/RAD55 family RecA-like ATPase
MNENEMSQLDAELEHAGEETALSPQMLLLEKLRITPEKELPKMDFLFRLFDKPCFPRRELVAITGKAKSGKTFVTSMLMAVGSQEGSINQLPLKRIREEQLHVLWYDTEQSDESTQDILKNRIMKLAADKRGLAQADLFDAENNSWSGKMFDVFNVRGVAWKERRSLLCEAVTRCKPDLVIVDGIRDLVNDINDGMLAQEVMEELMHLATEHKCCIVCVLHQNKGSEDHNLRGWIGTELMNKAFEVYACEKLMPKRIFKVEQTLTRKYDIEQKLYFEVDPKGLPRLTAVPVEDTGEDGNASQLPSLNRKYVVNEDDGSWHIDLPKLIGDVMVGREQITGSELKEQVCNRANIGSWKFYNKLLEQAVNERIIMKSFDKVGHVIYTPAPF